MIKHLDDDKINELLHFLKAIKSFTSFFSMDVKSPSKWILTENKSHINPDGYRANKYVRNLLRWIDKYILVCRFLDVNRYCVDEMADIYGQLKEPQIVVTLKHFSHLVDRLIYLFGFVEKDVQVKSSRLTCSECIRLDEALVCFENYSYYASVIMAVSAVEARITDLIKKKAPNIYRTTFSQATLGQLIQVFEPGKYTDKKYMRIKSLMPAKHWPLITLLNHYRVFSAHPVGEVITAQIAESILHLSFAFLLDPATTVYSKKQLKCK